MRRHVDVKETICHLTHHQQQTYTETYSYRDYQRLRSVLCLQWGSQLTKGIGSTCQNMSVICNMKHHR